MRNAKIIFLFLMVCIVCFGLGFVLRGLYDSSKNQSEIMIEKNPDNITLNDITKNDLTQGGYGFVASKNSDIFYSIECGVARRIREENRVYFKTKDEAIQDGFVASSSC